MLSALEESNKIYVLFFPSLVNIHVCTFVAHNSGEACRHLKVSLTLGKILARLPLVSSCVTMPCCPMYNPPITLLLIIITIPIVRFWGTNFIFQQNKRSLWSTWPLPLKTQVCLRHLCLSAFFWHPACLPTYLLTMTPRWQLAIGGQRFLISRSKRRRGIQPVLNHTLDNDTNLTAKKWPNIFTVSNSWSSWGRRYFQLWWPAATEGKTWFSCWWPEGIPK